VGGLAPLATIAVRAAMGTLGAEPVAIALNQLGLVALVFLIASLGCTPLKIVFGWTWPIRIRKMLGLFAFFYASLHLATYAAIDQGWNFAAMWADVSKREFISKGFFAFVFLVPLAVTSTAGWVKRLGFERWKALHRLAYLACALGALHFWLRVKKDHTEPAVYAAILAVLLLARLVDRLQRRRGTAGFAPRA
jgi:sulfoxide reductase heme-binding subunit YedZ